MVTLMGFHVSRTSILSLVVAVVAHWPAERERATLSCQRVYVAADWLGDACAPMHSLPIFTKAPIRVFPALQFRS